MIRIWQTDSCTAAPYLVNHSRASNRGLQWIRAKGGVEQGGVVIFIRGDNDVERCVFLVRSHNAVWGDFGPHIPCGYNRK